VTATALAETYGDGDKNPVGVSEAWVAWRPFPRGAVRWQVKLGAFHLPVSLEHRTAGWTSPYTLSASALNTWVGEEFRVLGTEVEARWLGASSGYRGDIALVGGVYGWNDGAGAVIADRGWALTDRPALLFSGLGRPRIDLYYEIDGRPGYYAGVSWRHHDRLELRVLHYDNRADPGAHNADLDFAWKARFTTAGLRLEPGDRWTLAAQYIDGITYVGPEGSDDQFAMRLSAWYGLASAEFARDRLTVRFDKFTTRQDSGFYGPPADDAGHALTVALMHQITKRWELAAEWLRVESRFPPRRTYGLPVAATERQLQLAVRYRFRLDVG
jgi:hypothetical protein